MAKTKTKKPRVSTIVRPVQKTTSEKTEEVNDNPFAIMEDLEYAGNRSNLHLLNSLAEQCMKLDPNNRAQSVNIPVTICPSRTAAANLFLQLRRQLSESKVKAMKEAHFTSRGIFSVDGKKTYLGSRIWRTK